MILTVMLICDRSKGSYHFITGICEKIRVIEMKEANQ
jgi:hypothetical protein